MPARRHLLTACAALLAGVDRVSCASEAMPGRTTPPITMAAPVPVPPPPEGLAELPGAVWSGSARMRYFGFDVYDARLWVASNFRARDYGQYGLVLELTYLRGLNGHAIAQRSIDEMRRVGPPLTPAQEQRWLAAMQTAFPDVRAGDRITGLHEPGIGARFWYNGQPRATVRDPAFSLQFFGIWLAESTSEPQLRTALLAGAPP